MKKVSILAAAVLLLGPGLHTVRGQLPANFPTSTVLTNYAAGVAKGFIFAGINSTPTNLGYYALMLTNDGTPVWYRELTNACYDFKVLPNGYLHYAQQIRAFTYTGGGDVLHQVLDENFNVIESIQAGNGYIAEAHDFQMLPNGDVLVVGYYLTQVDMSQVVSNGNPAALVSGAVIQELDAQRHVVWQWRSWDRYPFTREWVNSTAAVISSFHVNCVSFDRDGNLLISTPQWIKKISRQTGDIMWHLGDVENQFTFVGVSPQEGTNDVRGHAVHRLSNGNILLYNNAQSGAPGGSSQAHEFALDETNKIATHVWSYNPSPAVNATSQGNAQRLANNNTFVGWGGVSGSNRLNATEVTGTTNVVFQIKFNTNNVVSYRTYRFPFPSQSQAVAESKAELATGNSYDFGATGVSIEVQNGGGGYNRITVTRDPYAPIYPLFQGKAPGVLPVRVRLDETAIDTFDGTVYFDTGTFGLTNPTNLTVNYRSQPGQGLFLPQITSYNPVTHKLSVAMSFAAQGGDLGEFIFCYPDVADVPYLPILNEVESYRGVQPFNVIAPRMAVTGMTYTVNQQLPVLLSWSPKGFARSYQLQIGTNDTFASPLVSVGYQVEAFYVWSNAAPGATYFYRVKTVNEGGESDWSVGSFHTVPAFLTVLSPNGGEALQRGLRYFLRWNDNVAESVNLELYKGGVFYKTIATNVASLGAFQWQIGFDVAPANDYTLKVVTTNSSFSDLSDASFTIIDAPTVTAGSILRLADGRVQFGISTPGASQVTVFGSADLSNWQSLQAVSLSGGGAVFTDDTATNFAHRFYRLRVP